MNIQPIASTEDRNIPSIEKTEKKSSDFSSYLNTSSSLEEIFTEAAQKYDVPKDLLKAIAKAESDFNPNATSKSGAQGIMQLMPATARSLGVTNAYDPKQNIMGGAKYISEMLNKYDGNVSLALAAYNAGSNNVAKYGGIPPFKETQNYVVKVTGYLNQGISVPNVSYTTTQSTNTSANSTSITAASTKDTATENILDEIFTYEDYLNFLDYYMKLQETEATKEKEEAKKENNNLSTFSYQEIKWSPAMLNIL